jgi:ABC-2 type transport system ATP-binding protein
LVLQGEFYGITGRELKERAAESLERFGLAAAANRQVKTYSGGMQRLLDVALGLIHRPRVLFLDEPTTGLDPEARAGLWHEIERLAREENMTILLTTHYMEEADRLAARLAIVDQGRIVAEGTPDQLKSELAGDTIQIELADPGKAPARLARAALALGRVRGIGAVTVEESALGARVRNGAEAIPSVLAVLEEHGLSVASATLARPSLEDVYLRHAGRSFQRAEAEPERLAA